MTRISCERAPKYVWRYSVLGRISDESRMCALTIALIIIGGCGGGGGGDGGGGGGGADDEDPTGIWTGTDARDGGASSSVQLVVSSGGRFVSISGGLYLSGTGTIDGAAFTATATGWPPVGVVFQNGASSGSFSLTGTAFEGATISSAYSGSGESGRLTLNYNSAASNKSSSAALIAGSYMTLGGGALSISGSTLSFNSSAGPNCIGNGTIRNEDATRNVYLWSLTLSGCDKGNGNLVGVGFLEDSTPGTNNRVVLLGNGPTDPEIFVATK